MSRNKLIILVTLFSAVFFVVINALVLIPDMLFTRDEPVPVYLEVDEPPVRDLIVIQDSPHFAWIYDPDFTEYFPRVYFDGIDFASMVMPTTTPIGQIGHWYVRYISTYLPNRIPFTYRELDAALWKVHMFRAMGFGEEQVQVQTFSREAAREYTSFWWMTMDIFENMGWFDNHFRRWYSQNVIVTIPGRSQQTIIIGAHYDSPEFPSASDNASGTALLMESAQRMLSHDNYYTLVYVFFGAEEVGLLGVYYYYASLSPQERENILFMINADVLLDGSTLFYATGYLTAEVEHILMHVNRPDIGTNAITERIDDIATELYHTHNMTFVPRPNDVFLPSDQLTFLENGHTVLVFWGAEIYGDYFYMQVCHTYRDCYEYISTNWPGRIENAMGSFGTFLETLLINPPSGI